MSRFALLIVVLVSMLLVAPVGCQKKLPPQHSPQALLEQPLPPIRVNRIDVGPTSLKAAKDKPTVLALWATWCDPCREEIPVLMHWYRMQEEVELIVLNVDELSVDLTEIRQLAGEFGLDAPLLATTPAKASPLGLRALPVVYVIDKEGVVRDINEGFVDAETLLAWLESSLSAL